MYCFINRFFYPDLSATGQLLSDLAFHVARTREVHVVTSRLHYDAPADAGRLPTRETVAGAVDQDCDKNFISDEALQMISAFLPTNKAELAGIDGLSEDIYTTSVGLEILKVTVRLLLQA